MGVISCRSREASLTPNYTGMRLKGRQMLLQYLTRCAWTFGWFVPSQESGCMYQLAALSTAACDFSSDWPSPFFKRGLHLDFEVLQWSKLVDIWGTQNETKCNPRLMAIIYII